jgi:hypothetical protein
MALMDISNIEPLAKFLPKLLKKNGMYGSDNLFYSVGKERDV